MLLEMFLLLQTIVIISFAVAFFRKSEFFWAFTLILSAVLVFASYDVVQNVSVVNNQTMIGNTVFYQNTIIEKHMTDKTYSFVNMGIFLLSLVLFIFDLFINWRDNKSAKR